MFNAYQNTANEAQAFEALRLAQIHAETTDKPMKSSAAHCASEAEAFFNKGMFGFAHEWSCESLRYSVGILHADYSKAWGDARRGGAANGGAK